jgi:hypothetical protein
LWRWRSLPPAVAHDYFDLNRNVSPTSVVNEYAGVAWILATTDELGISPDAELIGKRVVLDRVHWDSSTMNNGFFWHRTTSDDHGCKDTHRLKPGAT